jgi:hypothetical protein
MKAARHPAATGCREGVIIKGELKMKMTEIDTDHNGDTTKKCPECKFVYKTPADYDVGCPVGCKEEIIDEESRYKPSNTGMGVNKCQIRIQKIGDTETAMISVDDGNWKPIADIFGLIGDFDIRFPVALTFHQKLFGGDKFTGTNDAPNSMLWRI